MKKNEKRIAIIDCETQGSSTSSSRIISISGILVNSEPVNSLLITATPFDWMEVSLRYADINTAKYSPYPSFSGDQTYKDK